MTRYRVINKKNGNFIGIYHSPIGANRKVNSLSGKWDRYEVLTSLGKVIKSPSVMRRSINISVGHKRR